MGPQLQAGAPWALWGPNLHPNQNQTEPESSSVWFWFGGRFGFIQPHSALLYKRSGTAASRKGDKRMAKAVCIPKRDNRDAQGKGVPPKGPEKHEHLCFLADVWPL